MGLTSGAAGLGPGPGRGPGPRRPLPITPRPPIRLKPRRSRRRPSQPSGRPDDQRPRSRRPGAASSILHQRPKAGPGPTCASTPTTGSWRPNLTMRHTRQLHQHARLVLGRFRAAGQDGREAGQPASTTIWATDSADVMPTGSWDWNEDKTVNTAGIANLNKIDQQVTVAEGSRSPSSRRAA